MLGRLLFIFDVEVNMCGGNPARCAACCTCYALLLILNIPPIEKSDFLRFCLKPLGILVPEEQNYVIKT